MTAPLAAPIPGVPPSLRTWFSVHCVADLIFAIPLFLAPVDTMRAFGFTAPEPVATRLVAAALFGIGLQSQFGKHADLAAYRSMLNLKVIWSGAAVLGLALSIAQGAPKATWLFLAIFVAFNALWFSYRQRLARL